MTDELNEKSDEIYDNEKLMDSVDGLYQFVMYSMDFYNVPQNYGNGEYLNMVEMHTLVMIAEHPGLRVCDVAKLWNRTLGAASKNVNKLVKKGYVTKQKLSGNNKNIHLYATEQGERLVKLHNEYDKKHVKSCVEDLLKYHTPDDLYTFSRVMKSLTAKY